MFRPLLIAANTMLLAAACATAQGSDSEAPGWLEKDFAEFVEAFEGDWDNDRHVFFAEDAGMDLDPIAPAQHISIQRLSDDDSEQAVFEATRTVKGEAPAILFHTFSIDADQAAILQTMSLSAESPSDNSFNCNVSWQRAGAQFQGRANGAGCDQLFPRPEADGDLSVTMTLSATEYWVTAARGDASTQARFRKARPFECWTAILRGAAHGDSGEGMRDWDFRRGVKLHDQGGEAVLMTDEDPARKIRLRLRNVDWPYGTNRPSLTLYIMEGESDRAVSYAWNEGDAERIGINLRWIQASCTHTPG